jgi:hypothetical protein
LRLTLKKVGFSLLLTTAAISFAEAAKWPVIRPMKERRAFLFPRQNRTDASFIALIKDTDGIPVYKLECHSGNYDDETEIAFSGDFQCALFAMNGVTRSSGNLFAAETRDEQSTDWWNRGRMRAPQLRGDCLKFPEYSTDRQFRLRGMLLTLRFVDVKWGPRDGRQDEPLLEGFTFVFTVARERSAQSSKAELAAGPQPSTACYP